MARDPNKRGRLSAIDLLPEEASPYVVEAREQLIARKRPAEDIRSELNTHLLGIGTEPISRGAFNRFSLGVIAHTALAVRAREACSEFLEKLGDIEDGNMGLALSEMGKTIIYMMIEKTLLNGGEISPKDISTIALACQRFELTRKSAFQVAVIKKTDLAEQKVSDAVDVAARAAGLSAETAEAIKAKILGILPTTEQAA